MKDDAKVSKLSVLPVFVALTIHTFVINVERVCKGNTQQNDGLLFASRAEFYHLCDQMCPEHG